MKLRLVGGIQVTTPEAFFELSEIIGNGTTVTGNVLRANGVEGPARIKSAFLLTVAAGRGEVPVGHFAEFR